MRILLFSLKKAGLIRSCRLQPSAWPKLSCWIVTECHLFFSAVITVTARWTARGASPATLGCSRHWKRRIKFAFKCHCAATGRPALIDRCLLDIPSMHLTIDTEVDSYFRGSQNMGLKVPFFLTSWYPGVSKWPLVMTIAKWPIAEVVMLWGDTSQLLSAGMGVPFRRSLERAKNRMPLTHTVQMFGGDKTVSSLKTIASKVCPRFCEKALWSQGCFSFSTLYWVVSVYISNDTLVYNIGQ